MDPVEDTRHAGDLGARDRLEQRGMDLALDVADEQDAFGIHADHRRFRVIGCGACRVEGPVPPL